MEGEFHVRKGFSLAKISWFGVGGEAEFFFKPRALEELRGFLRQNTLPVTVLGNCSNVIIRDGGVAGVTLKLAGAFGEVRQLSEDTLEAGAACLDKTLANFAMERGIAGFEFLATIPGSIGGAVRMNAGCFGGEMKDLFLECTAVDLKGNLHVLKRGEITFDYRKSNLANDLIIISAILRGRVGSPAEIAAKMEENARKRAQTQPTQGKTCGSTFKNPAGTYAWKLITEAGLGGACVGGAAFSAKHANFIMNDGTATAADIEALGELARREVMAKFGINLEWEIERIGKAI